MRVDPKKRLRRDQDWCVGDTSPRPIAKKRTRKQLMSDLMEIEHQLYPIGKTIRLRSPQPKGRYRSEQPYLMLSVERIAKDAALQHVVRRYVAAHVGFPRKDAVKAEIRLNAYLTKQVPDKFKTRTFTVRSEGEMFVLAAKMYARIYQEDERLGGESTSTRDKRLKRAKKPLPMLVNRGEGPYIWGHDIGDLVFEAINVTWKTPSSCVVTFDIGS